MTSDSAPSRIDRPRPVGRAPDEPRRPSKIPGGRRRWWAIGAVAAIVVAIQTGRTIAFYAHHVTTDDAQVEGHVVRIAPEVRGVVEEVRVVDNQPVEAGELLVRIDARDLEAIHRQAEAEVERARARLAVAEAKVVARRTESTTAAADLRRYEALRAKREVSAQRYDAASAAAASSAAELEAARRTVAAARADVERREADLASAAISLGHTRLVAPTSGRVTKKTVEVGQYVEPGQPLLAIVDDRDLWIVANFKETQLDGVVAGSRATVEVDAYGVELAAHVDSIAAATGARFALLPPDNATGNFVKVVQRIPVKIRLDAPPDPERPLRVGMNVEATIELP